jgi:cyanophycinase
MIPKGSILLIGGAEDKGKKDGPDMEKNKGPFEQFEILKELLPQGSQRTKKIEIITTASEEPAEMAKSYKDAF